MKKLNFRDTQKYRDLKEKVLEDYNYECEDCGGNENLELSHITLVSLGGEKLDNENIRIKCYYCHKRRTKSDMNLFKKVRKLLKNNDIYEI